MKQSKKIEDPELVTSTHLVKKISSNNTIVDEDINF